MKFHVRFKQLEIEREAIKRENDKPKLEQIGKELAELKEQENRTKPNGKVKRHWSTESSRIRLK